MKRQLRCVFPRGMTGSQKLWVLPGEDRGQWLLLQLPKNTLPGTVMNLTLQAQCSACCACCAYGQMRHGRDGPFPLDPLAYVPTLHTHPTVQA